MNTNYSKQKEYIKKRIFQIKGSSTHVVFVNNKAVIITDEILNKGYLVKFDKEIYNWYQKRIDLVTIVCKPNQPLIFNNEVNTFHGFRHLIPVNEKYEKEVLEGLELMKDFIKEIICSGKQEQFDYLMLWLSYMCKGNKNDSILYLRGMEGIGK